MKITEIPVSRLSHLECSGCGLYYSPHVSQNFGTCCHKPLLAKYDLQDLPTRKDLLSRENTMWRYLEFLPVHNPANIISLGEGMTPILTLNRIARKLGLDTLLMKDEGLNPTGSFKARGISAAISKAKEFGIMETVIPTAGNAGGALAAYCAAAGMKATVIMPRHTPLIFQQEVAFYGARLILIEGLIDACGIEAQRLKQEQGLFDVSTLKEPYRLEGKKTLGFEIAEQMNWQLPDVILYPTGGGTGLIGIWKAFEEMTEMGWIKGKLPRMISVQSDHCSPVVQTFENRKDNGTKFKSSIASGLAVPKVFGMDLVMKVLHESGGTAISVPESDIIKAAKEISSTEGIMISPEGAVACLGLKKLLQSGILQGDEKVLLLNTGSGYKYFENYT